LNPFAHFSLAPTGTVRENPTQFECNGAWFSGSERTAQVHRGTTNRSSAGKNSKA
jgi:hypothetical protein